MWAVRCVQWSRGRWTCLRAWKQLVARRIHARSSSSFGACAVKMQGHPADGSWKDYSLPDSSGHFGPYGGVFVAETLRAALDELACAYAASREDREFQAE